MEIKIMKMDDGYELFVNSVLVKKGKVLAHIRKMANEIIFDSEETIRVESKCGDFVCIEVGKLPYDMTFLKMED